MVNTIKFRKGTRIGQPDAESDAEFLDTCFLDNGTYARATDVGSKECILVGRTGSGKSAIIEHVKRNQKNVVLISPESLALNNVADSKIIEFYEEAGVHLDAFYVLLWKHIFTVELLKSKYKIDSEQSQTRFLALIDDILRRNPSKQVALDYLKTWGERFWIETEYRVSEFTSKVEQSLGGSLHLGHGLMQLGAEGARKMNDEEKGQISQRGQRAVNQIQIRELSKVVEVLGEDIFPADGEPFYLCIDRLDEDWVGDVIRFKLLKALIETIKAFQQVRSLKILVTMRTDLMRAMLNKIESPGFQGEKFVGYNLRLRWNRQEIADMLNRRVQFLFEHQYSNHEVNLYEIVPTFMAPKVKTVDYIIDRTFFRPRDAIAFLNRCIEKAEGATTISPESIKAAEYAYSDERLKAVFDEWRREFPFLKRLAELMRGFADGSEVGHMRNIKLESYCMTSLADFDSSDRLHKLCENAAMDSQTEGLQFLQHALAVLYIVGIVGLKVGPTTSRLYSFIDEIAIEPYHISLGTKVYVHKAFWVTLGVTTTEFDSRQVR